MRIESEDFAKVKIKICRPVGRQKNGRFTMHMNKLILVSSVTLLFQTIASAGDNFIIIANKNDTCFRHQAWNSSTAIRSTEDLSEFMNLYFNGKEIPMESFFSGDQLNYWIAQNNRRSFCF